MVTELNVRGVAEAVYDDLRHRVLVGEEQPGTVLTEVAVATRYGVARPTAKVAIERLASDGLLVRSRRGLGAAVRTLSRVDIVDLYESRILLESAVHRRLAQLRDQVKEPSALNQALRAAADRDDARDVVSADVAFHRALVAVSCGPRLIQLHDQLMGEAHFCMAQVQELSLLGADQIANEHDLILSAIRSGDSVLVETHTHDHLERARTQLLMHFFPEQAAE